MQQEMAELHNEGYFGDPRHQPPQGLGFRVPGPKDHTQLKSRSGRRCGSFSAAKKRSQCNARDQKNVKLLWKAETFTGVECRRYLMDLAP